MYLSSIVTLLDCHRVVRDRATSVVVGPGDWNETASLETDAYAYAKVRAERRARTLLGELAPATEFASVLPGPVLGPPAAGRRVPASVEKVMGPLLSGQLRWGSVDITPGIVDARDVARVIVALARLDAGALPRAASRSRFVCVADRSPNIQAMADAIREAHPRHARALPSRALPLPRPLLLAAMRASVTPEAFSYTRAMMGRRVTYDTALTRQLLGADFTPWEATVRDTVRWLDALPPR